MTIVSMVAARAGWSSADVASIRDGGPTGDGKMDALIAVVREAAGDAGRVSAGAWESAERAGWEGGELVDAFSAVALVVFTAYFLNYAGTEIDAELLSREV